MKYFISLLFIVFTISFAQSQIQSGEITYKIKGNDKAFLERYNSDPASERQKSFAKKWYEKQKRAVPFLKYHLIFNKTESLFKNHYRQFMKSDNGDDLEVATQVAGVAGEFYTNIQEEEVLNQLKYLNRNWLISHNIKDLKWRITEETKTILGYSCKKAIVDFDPIMSIGGEITAWFTTEIPFQFGPTTFVGLPGMILQVDQGNYTFYATDIKLNKEAIKIKKPKGKPQPVQEFQKERKKLENKLKGMHAQ